MLFSISVEANELCATADCLMHQYYSFSSVWCC